MLDWLRFWLTAACLAGGLLFFAGAVIGNCRFRYVMNRIHAAGLGDTLGLFLTALALSLSAGSLVDALRLWLPVLFLWITSPVSSHFLGLTEYYTGTRLYEHMERK